MVDQAEATTKGARGVAASRVGPGAPGRTGGRSRRWLLGGTVAAAVVGLFLWKGRPWVDEYFSHVETDDAYVTAETTVLPARIADVVEAVYVENTDFVERGAVLVRLDRVPFELAVEQKKSALAQAQLKIDEQVASLDEARADLDRERDKVRGLLAGLRASWHAVEGSQDQVRFRIASLKSALASQRAAGAESELAHQEHERVRRLVEQHSATQEELDQRRAAWLSAREQVKAAEQRVQQARALLALPPDLEHPDRIPADLERTDADVRRYVALGQQLLADLNVVVQPMEADPFWLKQSLESLSTTSTTAYDRMPAVRSAQSKIDQILAALGGPNFDPAKRYEHPSVVLARKDLEEAALRLSYTEIRAPVAGFVDRKAVNPGDHVQEGQGLLRIQPLDGVYIMANFREIQLADIRIGQPVDIHVDAYGDRVFKGRVSGFAPATGASSSLLPAENATGNFVKVVQRLPVRIDLIEPNPLQTPLYVGLSVIPRVAFKEQPAGPDAGQRLRGASRRTDLAKAATTSAGAVK